MSPKIPQNGHFLTTKFDGSPNIMSTDERIVVDLGQYCIQS